MIPQKYLRWLLPGLLFLVFFTGGIKSQGLVSGYILNFEGEPLIGATVQVGQASGTVTDENGYFELNLQPGKHRLQFQYLGYNQVVRTISIDSSDIDLSIEMTPASQYLDIITITGSKYEKNITDEVVTIEVIRPEFIERNNNTTLAEVINRVPGVHVIDGQANIRSGSGWTLGVGSRVSLLLDGQPLLSPELSDILWNFVPLENVEQIEIIKGSSSVLYGSGGLNGVMNIITAKPTSEPYTSVSTYTGLYVIPQRDERRWYSDVFDGPLQAGTYIAHRRKLSENFDLTFGTNFHYQNGYNKLADERRIRSTLITRFRPFADKGIAMGVNINAMYDQEGIFYLAQDAAEKAYIHIEDPYRRDRNRTLTIDAFIQFFDRGENKHLFKIRYFDVLKLRRNAPYAPSAFYNGEYQYQRKFSEDFVVTTGVSASHITSKSNLFDKTDTTFTENDTTINYPREYGNIGALYLQMDKKFGESFNLSGGIRWEIFNYKDAVQSNLPVFKGGLSHSFGTKHFLRFSFGQGFRIPSLTERFIDDNLADLLKILPNPDLKTEKGWSAEFGYKRSISARSWNGYVDIAAFWMEFHDMTEFLFDLHRPDSIVAIRPNPNIEDFLTYLGFRSVNISRARIAGFEVTAQGEGTVWGLPLRIWGGYTYSYPADLSADSSQMNIGTFLDRLSKSFWHVDSTLATGILKYRNLHTVRLDAEIDIGKFTFGLGTSYTSFMHNVDEIVAGEGPYAALVEFINDGPILPNINEFRDERRNGDWIFDFRCNYRLGKNKFSFIINNLFNREYASRPGKMNAPLGLTLRWNIVL